ncbi:MAG: hypothetical protein P4L43_17735 [Syntrophobacteraceae bacterium]|nr:hypothetical protein [Syntrophobacteraceae bacterium]
MPHRFPLLCRPPGQLLIGCPVVERCLADRKKIVTDIHFIPLFGK